MLVDGAGVLVDGLVLGVVVDGAGSLLGDEGSGFELDFGPLQATKPIAKMVETTAKSLIFFIMEILLSLFFRFPL